MDVCDTLRLALADRYRIEREFGQGGMASVYLAQAQRHHRKVAIKVLRPGIPAALGAGSTPGEIQIAARLQCPIFPCCWTPPRRATSGCSGE